MELNKKLIFLRKKKGLSQAELAETIKVSRQAVSRWEVGSALPTSENLKYLSKVYEVSLEYLISEDGEDKAEAEDVTGKATCGAEAKICPKKKLIHRSYYLAIALAVLMIGVWIGYAIHKNAETEPKKENVISIEEMARDEGAEKIKEEDFSSK